MALYDPPKSGIVQFVAVGCTIYKWTGYTHTHTHTKVCLKHPQRVRFKVVFLKLLLLFSNT